MEAVEPIAALPPTAPPESGSIASRTHAENRDETERSRASLGLEPLARWLEEAPAWLASGMLHLATLILLALLALGSTEDDALSLSLGVAEDFGEQLIEESFDVTSATEPEVEEQLLTPDLLPEVADPLATPPTLAISPDAAALSSELVSVTPGAALSGRTVGSKAALLKAFGGTEATEEAVLEGLRWLARQQRPDGGWSLKGPYPNGSKVENREAATAMALLAFQGAGYLPSSSRADFGREVSRGWRFLLSRQAKDGSFFKRGNSNHRFYTQAQCTIAICELLAMTGDENYREPATRAISYLVETQSDQGGWRYRPGIDSDLSVTGWVLMALKSGQMAKIPVRKRVIDRVSGYLDRIAVADSLSSYGNSGSRYVYKEEDIFNREAIPTMTSVGLLCRQYLGWRPGDRRLENGIRFLLTHKPEWRRGKVDLYYWYYATQAILHAGGPSWPEWNVVMREVLPANQEKGRKERRGSWFPADGAWHHAEGGRLYTTCLAIYTLEVYYRHLPLYQQRATD